MFSRSTNVILLLAVLAAVLGGIVQHRRQAPPEESAESTLVGKPLPALILPDLEGRAHALSDYRGRRLLINFWASWCGPCLKEMPALNQAQEKFGGQGAIVLGIAMDEPTRVRAFLRAHPVSYPILLGRIEPPSTSLQLGDKREILPFSVLVDAAGRIIATHAGVLSRPQLEQWLAPATTPP
ncbi:MAG: TlpA family protein disulfide reductase [Rhodanobacter sp.]|nr:MAG: TlpA family protein disulfide reductase [Rhodanobacter sp.]TAM02926.1 MAG: TlpA family protein disulfide reductase [Rhodanobacter sp.]TAM41901.1 MAG: TlpA family protein disulfide reductase [Rhodanobacter sp.]TAN29190.1 MAG: TlpA family protein disulfide reductase [Rhodanobacter sp.]